MSRLVVSRYLFTIVYPEEPESSRHVPGLKLRSLARNQLPSLDVIETIDHLFVCQRCFENYRHVRLSSLRSRLTPRSSQIA